MLYQHSKRFGVEKKAEFRMEMTFSLFYFDKYTIAGFSLNFFTSLCAETSTWTTTTIFTFINCVKFLFRVVNSSEIYSCVNSIKTFFNSMWHFNHRLCVRARASFKREIDNHSGLICNSHCNRSHTWSHMAIAPTITFSNAIQADRMRRIHLLLSHVWCVCGA